MEKAKNDSFRNSDKGNKEKFPWMVLIIAVLALALGWLFFFNQQPTQKEEFVNVGNDEISTQFIEETPVPVDPNFDEKTYVPWTSKTLEECKEMESLDMQEKCFGVVALTKKDSSICDQIESIENKDLCFMDYSYYLEKPELCDKVMEGKSDCLVDLAVKTLDAKYCANADKERKLCLEAVALNNENKCYETIDGRWECRQAVQAKNSELCNAIESKKEACYYYVATGTSNADLCAKTDANMANTCYFRIALDKQNTELCSRLSGGIEASNNCIGWIAFDSGNINLCYQITSAEEKQACIEDIMYEQGSE